MKLKEFVAISRVTFSRWRLHKVPLRASALAFFAIFPLPSLLLILVAILGLRFGHTAAFHQVIQQVSLLAGPAIAGLVTQILESASNPFASLFTSVMSVVFALVGAAGAFGVLQESMNTIWEAHAPSQKRFIERITYNIIPLLLVSILGFIVFVWTSITSVIFALIDFVFKPSFVVSVIVETSNLVLGFLLAFLLFAIIYKIVPDTKIEWKDVVLASVISAFIFVLSNLIFLIYVPLFSSSTAFGAAGSLMLLLLWIYIVSHFLLFGAEFSRAYAEGVGSRKRNEK